MFGPEKLDSRPTARIRLQPDAGVRKDPLFSQILRRRTNREAYELREPEGAALQAIAASVAPHPFRCGFVGAAQPQALQQHRDGLSINTPMVGPSPRRGVDAHIVG